MRNRNSPLLAAQLPPEKEAKIPRRSGYCSWSGWLEPTARLAATQTAVLGLGGWGSGGGRASPGGRARQAVLPPRGRASLGGAAEDGPQCPSIYLGPPTRAGEALAISKRARMGGKEDKSGECSKVQPLKKPPDHSRQERRPGPEGRVWRRNQETFLFPDITSGCLCRKPGSTALLHLPPITDQHTRNKNKGGQWAKLEREMKTL